MKMRTFSIMLSLIFLFSSFMSITAFAASTSSQDGIVATLSTDSESYDLDEEIDITLTVENTNTFDIGNVTTEIMLPSGVTVVSGAVLQDSFTLLAGESNTHEITAIKVESTATSGGTTSSGETDESVDTGDNLSMVFWVVLAMISFVGLILVAIQKKKNKMLSMVGIIVTLSVLSVSATAITADASTVDNVTVKTFTVSETIIIDGEETLIEANISYDYESTEEETVTLSFETGTGTEVEDVVLNKGEALGYYPYTVKENADFLGWYTDPAYSEAFDSEQEINESMTIYASFEDQGTSANFYDATEMFLTDQSTDFSFTVYSANKITSSNLENYVQIVEVYGPSEATGETLTFNVSASGNNYTITANGGYAEGGFYDVYLSEGVTLVAPLEDSYNADALTMLSFQIYKEESDIVEYQEDAIFVQVDSSLVSLTNTGEGVVSGYGAITNEDMATILSTYIPSDSSAATKTGIEVGDILIINDGDDVSSYGAIKVTSVTLVDGVGYSFTYEGADYSDIYSNVDVYYQEELSVSDMLADVDTELMAQEIKESEGVEQLTYLLAAAIYESEEIAAMGDGSDPITIDVDALMAAESIAQLSSSSTLSNNVYFNNEDENVAIDIEELYEGLNVYVTIGQMTNDNFVTMTRLKDECFGVNVIVEYEVKLDNGVFLKATIDITESFVGSLAGSGNSYSTFSLDFNYYVILEAETDISFEILVCSAEIEDGETPEVETPDEDDFPTLDDFTDISEEITESINSVLTDEELEEENDNIVSRMMELLEEEGDSIELFNAPIATGAVNVYGLFDINLYFNFVVSVEFAAGIQTEFSYLDTNIFGVEGSTRDMSIDFYNKTYPEYRKYSFDFYAAGYLGLKAGLQSEISISLPLLADAGELGAGFEIGAYIDIYGYLHYNIVYMGPYAGSSESLNGGIYMEMGVYVEVYLFARSEWFDQEAEWTPVEMKFPLFDIGDQYVYMQLAEDTNAAIQEESNVFLEGEITNIYSILPTYYGEYLDITTGDVVERPLTSGYYSISETTDIPYVSIAYVQNADGNWSTAVKFDQDEFDYYNRYYEYKGELCLEDVFGNQYEAYYVGEDGDLFAEDISIDISYMPEQLLSPSTNMYRYIGTQTFTWIADGFDGYGETYTATFAIETDDGLVTIGSREVIAGRETGEFDVYANASDELKQEYVLDSYTSYDNSLGSYVTECAYTWNVEPDEDHMTGDTTYIITAEKRQSYVGFVYQDNGQWKYDLMVLENGETPVISAEDGEHYTVSGYSVYDCSAGTLQEVADVNNLSATTTYVDAGYLSCIYGEATSTYESDSQVDAQYSLMSIFQYYGDANLIYIANYDFEQYKVTYVTNKGEVVEYVDYYTMPQNDADVGWTTLAYQYFEGWSREDDNTVDYTIEYMLIGTYISDRGNYCYQNGYASNLPISNTDVTYYAVYSGNEYTVEVDLDDGETHTWTDLWGNQVDDDNEVTDFMMENLPEDGYSQDGNIYYSGHFYRLLFGGYTGNFGDYYTAEEIQASIEHIGASSFYWGDSYFTYKLIGETYYKLTLAPGDGSFDADVVEEALASLNSSDYYFNGTYNEDGTITVFVMDTWYMEPNHFVKALVEPEVPTDDVNSYYYQLSHWVDQDGNEYAFTGTFPESSEAMTFTPIYEKVYYEYSVGVYNTIGDTVDITMESVNFTGTYDEYLEFIDEYVREYDDEEMDTDQYDYTYVDTTTTKEDGFVTKIYIDWTRVLQEYTVTYTDDVGEGSSSVADIQYGNGITVTGLSNIVKEDYTNEFLGWDSDEDGAVDYESGDSITVKGNMTLVAVWQQTCTISFYNASGTVGQSFTGVVDEAFDVSEVTEPAAPDNMKFVGWDTDLPDAYTVNMTIKPTYEYVDCTVTFALTTDGVTEKIEVTAKYNDELADVITEKFGVSGEPSGTTGKIWSGWSITNIGATDFANYTITDDVTVNGTITTVYVIYTLDGVVHSKVATDIDSSVTVADQVIGYSDWSVTGATVTDGTFTMPSADVTFAAYKDLDGTFSISDGTNVDVFDATTHEASTENDGVSGYTFKEGMLNITSNGLTLTGEVEDIIIIVDDKVTNLTLSELTVQNTTEKDAESFSDIFPANIQNMESNSSINKYLLFIYSTEFTLNIDGEVTLNQSIANFEDSNQYHICYMPLEKGDYIATDGDGNETEVSGWIQTQGTMTIEGTDSSELVVDASMNETLNSSGNVVVNNVIIDSTEWKNFAVYLSNEYGEDYTLLNGNMTFNSCDITTSGGISSAQSLIFNDCTLDIGEVSANQSSGLIELNGATSGSITSSYKAIDTYNLKVALDPESSVTVKSTDDVYSAIGIFGELTLDESTSTDSAYMFVQNSLYKIDGETKLTEITFTGN